MGGRLLEGPTMVGRKEELGRWLKPFLDRGANRKTFARVGTDQSWRSQEHSTDGETACTRRMRSIDPELMIRMLIIGYCYGGRGRPRRRHVPAFYR